MNAKGCKKKAELNHVCWVWTAPNTAIVICNNYFVKHMELMFRFQIQFTRIIASK